MTTSILDGVLHVLVQTLTGGSLRLLTRCSSARCHAQESIATHPLELLELLGELLHGLRVLLPHLLDLGLVRPRLLIQGLLQHRHLLLPLGPGQKGTVGGGCGETESPRMGPCEGPRAAVSTTTAPWTCDPGWVA